MTDRAEVDVLLRVQREGFVSAAAWASTLIAVTLAMFFVLLKPVIQHPGVVPSILLLSPGVVATIVGKAGDHRLTIRMLNLARRALLITAGCSFVATVGLALSRTGSSHTPRLLLWIIWGAVTTVAIYCAALLQLARRLPSRDAAPIAMKATRIMRPLIAAIDARFLRGS